MQHVLSTTVLLACTLTVGAQTFEPHSTDCIETSPLGLWSPWVVFDESEYDGQWFVADGPLGGICSSGGGYFAAGSSLRNGRPVDLRDLGPGNHFITAVLNPVDGSDDVRRVWNVQVTDPGDVNGDGSVNFGDFIVLSRAYGEVAGRQTGDLDYSGVVGFGDFVILSRNYGRTLNSQSAGSIENVPEPNFFTAAAAVLGLLCSRTRKRSG